MPLSITAIKAQLNINTTNAYIEIKQPKGQLSITQTKPTMAVDRQLPKVLIDQSQQFSEAGLKKWLELTEEYAQLGQQQAMKGISRIVEDGNRMAQIQRIMPPAIPELVLKNSTSPRVEVNIDFIPKSRPKIDVEGYLNIDWQLGKTDINYTVGKPIIECTPGKVDIYMKQYPKIEIKYIDNRV